MELLDTWPAVSGFVPGVAGVGGSLPFVAEQCATVRRDRVLSRHSSSNEHLGRSNRLAVMIRCHQHVFE